MMMFCSFCSGYAGRAYRYNQHSMNIIYIYNIWIYECFMMFFFRENENIICFWWQKWNISVIQNHIKDPWQIKLCTSKPQLLKTKIGKKKKKRSKCEKIWESHRESTIWDLKFESEIWKSKYQQFWKTIWKKNQTKFEETMIFEGKS